MTNAVAVAVAALRPPLQHRRSGGIRSLSRVVPNSTGLPPEAIRRAPLLSSAASPVVLKPSSPESSWSMYYSCENDICVAVSADGVHWREPTPTFLPNAGDWWAFDTVRVVPAAVIFLSGVYWLYYTGFTDDNVPMPGLAVSQDGCNWARIEGEDPSGALVGDAGAVCCVFVRGQKDFVMYCQPFGGKLDGDGVFVARSSDGIRWKKTGEVSVAGLEGGLRGGRVRSGNVVWDGVQKRWVMVYEGIGVDGKSGGIGLAESVDGLSSWTRCGEFPAVSTSAEGDEWDGEGVGSPYLVQLDSGDGWRIYYTGIGRNGMSGVGIAASGSLDLSGFKKLESDGN